MERKKGTKDEVLRIRIDRQLKEALFGYAETRKVKVSAVLREAIVRMVSEQAASR